MGTTDIFNWILNSLLWGFALCLVVRFAASLMVSSTFSVVKTKNVSRHCQISPEESGGGEAKSPLVENQRMSKKKSTFATTDSMTELQAATCPATYFMVSPLCFTTYYTLHPWQNELALSPST